MILFSKSTFHQNISFDEIQKLELNHFFSFSSSKRSKNKFKMNSYNGYFYSKQSNHSKQSNQSLSQKIVNVISLVVIIGLEFIFSLGWSIKSLNEPEFSLLSFCQSLIVLLPLPIITCLVLIFNKFHENRKMSQNQAKIFYVFFFVSICISVGIIYMSKFDWTYEKVVLRRKKEFNVCFLSIFLLYC